MISGVGVGVLSALRRGTVFDRAAMAVALAGVSLPVFFTGLLALSVFSYTLNIFPPGSSYTPLLENPIQWAYDLILPWVTLAFLYAAGYARLTRAGMLETMNEDYIRTARAKGLPERTVVLKHALRSTLTPVLTIFGLDLGLLVGGAILTESTFSLPGLGSYTVQAISHNDLPKVLGVTLLAATFVVIANLVVDILYAVIDPRVRL
nr:ABC transporter permease [Kineosporia mesophila]